MKFQKAKRFVAVASVLATAGIAPLVMATPASANQSDCVNYLRGLGIYQIGPGVKAACKKGEKITTWTLCVNELQAIQVRFNHAGEACNRAL